MGNALVMMIVGEEELALSDLEDPDPNKRGLLPLSRPGRWVPAERERIRREHPDAFWTLRVPRTAVWEPPVEPYLEKGPDWHRDPALLASHRERVRKSLEAFMNQKLAELDNMVRTGWFIIQRARASVTELEEVPDGQCAPPRPARTRSRRRTKRGL